MHVLLAYYYYYHLSLLLLYTGMAACPAPYSVDYDVAKSLNVQMTLVDSVGEVIGDASDAMEGSANRALQVTANYSSISVVFNLDDSSLTCDEWEITGFRITIVSVKTFVITIGSQSSRTVQVHYHLILVYFSLIIIICSLLIAYYGAAKSNHIDFRLMLRKGHEFLQESLQLCRKF